MKNTVISLRINKDVKESAQEVADTLGISLSTLINAYLRQVVATRQVELFAPEAMTPHMEALIAEAEKEIADGNISGGFTDIEDFLADLSS